MMTTQSGMGWSLNMVFDVSSIAGMSTAPAAAGVGIPTKKLEWEGLGGGVAEVNRASRSPEHKANVLTAIRPDTAAARGAAGLIVSRRVHWWRMSAGAT